MSQKSYEWMIRILTLMLFGLLILVTAIFDSKAGMKSPAIAVHFILLYLFLKGYSYCIRMNTMQDNKETP
jgi:hypothetical protein